jgi:predicted LPLAT superfamily acyltransferase
MKIWGGIKKRAEGLGHIFFYMVLHIGGQRLAYFFLYPILFLYILCSRSIHRLVSPYQKRRFPDHGWWQSRLDVFKIVHGFGRILVDRAWLGLKHGKNLSGTIDGLERLEEIIHSGSGAVLLLAHVGTWQNALSHMDEIDTDVHVLIEHDEEAVTKHFYELGRKRPFSIIDVNSFMGGMLEAKSALQKGGFVMVMGDRYRSGRYVTVEFMGEPIRLPAGAYCLAAGTGVPLVVAFSTKLNRKRHVFKVWDIMYPDFSRHEKEEEIARCAARFTAAMEAYVEQYPYQWYNFFNIWEQ